MGTGAAPSSSSFFRFMLPGFPGKQVLPREFTKSAGMEANCKNASLVNPNGEIWRVSVHRDGGDMYIGGPGWRELVNAHSLGLGFLLVFIYEGNNVFHFRVFDRSNCEVSYPSTANKTKPTPVIIQVDDDDEGEKEEPATARAKKGLSKSRGARFEFKSNAFKATKTPKQTPVIINVEGEEEEHKPVISQGANTARTSNASTKKGRAKGHAGEKRFEITISACDISRGNVYIPGIFRECLGPWPEQRELTLRDPKGRSWSVGIHRRNAKGKKLQLGLGSDWRSLARANKLAAGDRCVFELAPEGQGLAKVWQLTILKNRP